MAVKDRDQTSVADGRDEDLEDGGAAADKTDDDTAAAAAPPRPPPPPNGGYGWVCTACVAVINAHTWGLNSSYGVFLAHYLATDTYPGTTPLEYAFVGSLSLACALLVSPLATLGVRELGTKPTMMLGVVLEAASLVLASLSRRIWHLFLTQGILFGVGMGFLFVPSVPVVPQWFTTRRSLASGVATSGSGLGGLVYSLAAGAMIERLGPAWALRILGMLALAVNAVCVLLVRDRNRVIKASQLAFDLALLRRPEYVLLLAYGWFSMLAYVTLIFSLANYANEIGLGAAQAATVSAVFNLGQALGRPLIGYFSDRTGRIGMAALTTLLAAVSALAVWIPATAYGTLVAFALLGGAVAGTFWVTVAPVTAEVVGLRHVASGLNVMWLTIVLPCVFSEPIALQIVAGTGRYLGTQLYVAICFVAAAACTAVLRGWKIGEADELCRLTGQEPDQIDQEKTAYDDELGARAQAAGRKRMLLDCLRLDKV
ncbi:putative arabinose efflux permease, MFS family [Geosmithia morbida]|uniref:Arabinose efflux permease, MFS family n=1 Tax=Geosmithia morbida TaxID=1094350 RepID=A0A9P5D7W9_9HYPO|nr:putative arabinose efflux permease, MFS family [Geosmithia morbida]KAF4124939.1 putative arabinose efflux permease, MFS family [Geosmithia morbida]